MILTIYSAYSKIMPLLYNYVPTILSLPISRSASHFSLQLNPCTPISRLSLGFFLLLCTCHLKRGKSCFLFSVNLMFYWTTVPCLLLYCLFCTFCLWCWKPSSITSLTGKYIYMYTYIYTYIHTYISPSHTLVFFLFLKRIMLIFTSFLFLESSFFKMLNISFLLILQVFSSDKIPTQYLTVDTQLVTIYSITSIISHYNTYKCWMLCIYVQFSLPYQDPVTTMSSMKVEISSVCSYLWNLMFRIMPNILWILYKCWLSKKRHKERVYRNRLSSW